MKVVKKIEENDLAQVFIAENSEGKLIEFVESIQPPLTIKDKWVLILSTLFGCPVNCKFCDAGGKYNGKLSFDELIFQIDYMVKQRFPDRNIDTKKFKIQFARMGEPAFNHAVLDALEAIPEIYTYKNFIPSVSTIAPVGTDDFFAKLLSIKKRLYKNDFQLQFSLHSTDDFQRDDLVPVKKWSFEKISKYGNDFFDKEGKKITLNFALGKESILKTETLLKFFDPAIFLIKITPVNPTFTAQKNNITSLIDSKNKNYPIVDELKNAGYDVILSIGEYEENKIGSNCGQYLNTFREENKKLENSYSYAVKNV